MSEESGEVTAEQLKGAAQRYDAAVEAGEIPEVKILPEEPKEEVQGESPPEPAEEAVKEPETEGQDVDEQVSSLTEGEAPEAQEQPKSKWAKNEERKNNSWKHINAEKEELKRQREELLKTAEELKSRQGDLDEGKAYRDEKGFTAEDYENAAKRLKEEGDDDLASDAVERANEVRTEGEKAQQQRVTKNYWNAFEGKRQELMQKHTDLQKPDSELTQKANAILTEHPSMQSAAGLEQVVKIAQLQMKAAGADKSESQVKELTDKLTRLEKKMSVNGGFTNEKVNGDKSFDDLSDAEQTEYLRRAAMEVDDAM